MTVLILNIRNLSKEMHNLLQIRAAKAGRSMKAEAQEISASAVTQKEEKLSAVSQDGIDQPNQGNKH